MPPTDDVTLAQRGLSSAATEGAPARARETSATIIYVMGSARSGSTVLGVLLGSCDGVFNAGELDAWLRQSGIPAHPRPDRTEFWNAIEKDLRQYRDLCGDQCLRAFEHSSAFLRHDYWANKRLRKRYHVFNQKLFQAITAHTECVAVVDTSHYPLRARELRRTDGLQVVLVLLSRDADAVVESFRNTPGSGRKGLVAANGYLWLTQFLSLIVFLTHPRDRRVVVQYSELVAEPTSTVRRILNSAAVKSRSPVTRQLRTGLPLAGNRLLKQKVIELQSAGDARRRGPSVTAVLQWPWARALSLLAAREQ